MRINKTYNPDTKQFTADFPAWSAAYQDPNSQTSKLLNPFANALEFQDNLLLDIHNDSFLIKVDVDKHPHQRWLFNYQDIISYDDNVYDSANAFINSIEGIVASVSGSLLPVTRLTDVTDFYNPDMQTGWYVSGILEHGLSGQLTSCEHIGDTLYIVNVSGETQDPGTLSLFTLPDRWFAGMYASTEIELKETINDPTYVNIRVTATTHNQNERVLLDHQLKHRSDKISIIDVEQSRASGENIYITSGFTFFNTSSYRVMDTYLTDLDGDQITDQREIDLIIPHLGKSRTDFTDEEWESTYSKYDINGNGTIDDMDLNIISGAAPAIQNSVSAISFDIPSTYAIEYSIPDNNLPAIKAVYNNQGNAIYLRNTVYDYITQYWPLGYVDATFDHHKSLTYYLDNSSKCVWVYDNNGILGNTYDRTKILLPLSTGLQLRGIVYSNYRIYVLAVTTNGIKIITIRTDMDNPEEHISQIPIHSGNRSTDDTIIVRDEAGLSHAVSGLTIINGTKLVTIDGAYIKMLLPLYDYYVVESDVQGNPTVSFRENYDSIETVPSGTIELIYQDLWNVLDFHGEAKGIRRLPGETNTSFKKRILDVFVHFPSRDKQGSLYGMQREMGLPIETIATHNLEILPAKIDHTNADTVRIFDDGQEVKYDNIEIEHQYNFGKYTHDKIVYALSGQIVLTVDKDIIA